MPKPSILIEVATDAAFDVLKRADAEFMSSFEKSSGSDFERTGVASSNTFVTFASKIRCYQEMATPSICLCTMKEIGFVSQLMQSFWNG